MHLLLPLLASLLFVGALIFMKRAGESGASPLTILCVSNLGSGVIFSSSGYSVAHSGVGTDLAARHHCGSIRPGWLSPSQRLKKVMFR